MKKILAMLLALGLIFAFAGCSEKSEEEKAKDAIEDAVEDALGELDDLLG